MPVLISMMAAAHDERRRSAKMMMLPRLLPLCLQLYRELALMLFAATRAQRCCSFHFPSTMIGRLRHFCRRFSHAHMFMMADDIDGVESAYAMQRL